MSRRLTSKIQKQKGKDITQKQLNALNAAENNCEEQVVHRCFQRASEYSAASALRRGCEY
jgi:hypothetical protein